MGIAGGAGACRQVERVFAGATVAGLSEAQLLDRFVGRRDDAAFAAIVARHGPMVHGVCRQLLRDPNDVDDAVQATFLVLVRKAASLRHRERLGNWLYGVAHRVARRARASATKRSQSEARRGDMAALAVAPVADTPGGALAGDDRSIHEELARLPDRYRAPVVLCYLEGLTHEEAADRLGWRLGTVKGRLARARDVLRGRLVRRGLTLAAAGTIVSHWTSEASASARVAAVFPERLVTLTVEAAARAVAGRSLVGVVPATTLALSEGVLRTMTLSQIKSLAVAFGVAGALATGAGAYAYQAQGGNTEKPRSVDPPAAKPSPPATAEPKKEAEAKSKGGPTTRERPADPTSLDRPGQALGSSEGGGGFGGFGGAARVAGPMEELVGPVSDSLLDNQLPIEARFHIKIAQLAPKVAAQDTTPETKKITERLQQPISMKFTHETPLEDVLKYIHSSTEATSGPGLPIYVDPVGLQEVDKTMTSPVTLSLDGVPLKTTLRLVLKQLGLAYCVKDGLIIISSPAGIYQELLESARETGQEGMLPGMMGGGGMRGPAGARGMSGGFR